MLLILRSLLEANIKNQEANLQMKVKSGRLTRIEDELLDAALQS